MNKESERLDRSLPPPEGRGGRIFSAYGSRIFDTDEEIPDMFALFSRTTFGELESLLLRAESRDSKAFYRALLNLKLQIAQEKVVGEELL
ncbi:MAG: hypothetical protein ACOX4O_03160 [Eubacteriales bacterium]|jgi:hypothetical protein